MSIISTWEATPNRVGILYHFLDTSGPLSQEVLLSFLSPNSLQKKADDGEGSGSAVAKRVLAECQALGLVESAPEGNLQVPDQFRGLDPAGLRTLLTERLTHLDLAESYGQAQLPHALAWFLAQHPATGLVFRENLKEEIKAETGGRDLDLTNAARVQQFFYWVQYLGLGWMAQGINGSELMVDPTVALSTHLAAILSQAGEAPIREVIASLGERLPIVETGAARQDVEEWLPPAKRRGGNDLSPSTSVALLRLQRRGMIALERRSDAPVMGLMTWPDSQQVSHLVWKQTSAGR